MAWELWREMRDAGVTPDNDVYNALLLACMRSLQPGRACAVLQAMGGHGVCPLHFESIDVLALVATASAASCC